MATRNVYNISLPDNVAPIANELVEKKQLSDVIAELLLMWYRNKNKK